MTEERKAFSFQGELKKKDEGKFKASLQTCSLVVASETARDYGSSCQHLLWLEGRTAALMLQGHSGEEEVC